jgi:K+-transporting ATPase ATPase A chain
MTGTGFLQIVVFFGVVLILTKPLGLFMARLFQGERTFLHPVLRPVERLIYKLCGIREDAEQRWTLYAGGLLSFSVFAFLFVYFIQRLQGFLPFNPQGFGAKLVTPDLAYNTAISFTTNTNWQAYSGE